MKIKFIKELMTFFNFQGLNWDSGLRTQSIEINGEIMGKLLWIHPNFYSSISVVVLSKV